MIKSFYRIFYLEIYFKNSLQEFFSLLQEKLKLNCMYLKSVVFSSSGKIALFESINEIQF